MRRHEEDVVTQGVRICSKYPVHAGRSTKHADVEEGYNDVQMEGPLCHIIK